MRLIWADGMKWNGMDVFPRCLIKANVWAVGLCDCIGKLIALLCPLWLWSSCNFPTSHFSLPAAVKIMNTNYQLLTNHSTRGPWSECTNSLGGISLFHCVIICWHFTTFRLRIWQRVSIRHVVCVCTAPLVHCKSLCRSANRPDRPRWNDLCPLRTSKAGGGCNLVPVRLLIIGNLIPLNPGLIARAGHALWFICIMTSVALGLQIGISLPHSKQIFQAINYVVQELQKSLFNRESFFFFVSVPKREGRWNARSAKERTAEKIICTFDALPIETN